MLPANYTTRKTVLLLSTGILIPKGFRGASRVKSSSERDRCTLVRREQIVAQRAWDPPGTSDVQRRTADGLRSAPARSPGRGLSRAMENCPRPAFGVTRNCPLLGYGTASPAWRPFPALAWAGSDGSGNTPLRRE
jgi:hypothetical protein